MSTISQIRKQFEKGDTESNFLIRKINYKLVEEQSPMFSIKGRYEHGGIFQSQSKVGDINSLNSNNNQLTEEQSNLPVPKFNSVKPSLPSFSFGKAGRFDDLYPKNNSTVASTNEMIFSEGQFAPEDTKSYQTKEVFMGTARKSTICKDNGVPGPGYYKIKGFAEEVVEKGVIVNEIRTKIREKQLEKERTEKDNNNNTNQKDPKSSEINNPEDYKIENNEDNVQNDEKDVALDE